MSRILLLLFSGILTIAIADDSIYQISAEEWARPRHGDVLVQQPGLRSAVKQWINEPHGRIEIRFPGGEEGELWVTELRDWLVALGVPSASIEAHPGSGHVDRIDVIVKH